MRVVLLIVAVTLVGCSGPAKVRSPQLMAARAIPKAVKRIKGEDQSLPPIDVPKTEVSGNEGEAVSGETF